MVRVAAQESGREASRGDRDLRRVRLRCLGTVQGVGFRPAVYRLATRFELAGHVSNDADGATVEIEGGPTRVQAFLDTLRCSLPPLARLESTVIEELQPRGDRGFVVDATIVARRRRARIPADTRVCGDCRAEMDAVGNRRRRYIFTTCTNCGPRFSLSFDLPYDRERTSMVRFPLCPACESEYSDPSDRRFHAEPICCPACGPRLWLATCEGVQLARDARALRAARRRLVKGEILAVKGLGGFQLACRADERKAIARLRALKQRPSKPFALMARDIEVARRILHLTPEEEKLLRSPQAPILLAPRAEITELSKALAPHLMDLGVMLPTTPLHIELLRSARYDALVMTSGNARDEPIARTNEEALVRLAPFVDAFLFHDREVARRVDDSVVRSGPWGPIVLRRSRGYVPDPLPLPTVSPEPVLALGAHLQVTSCIAVGKEAFLSQHIGDLDTPTARSFHEEVSFGLEQFLAVQAKCFAIDLHPDYPSSWLGERLSKAHSGHTLRIQHHLAHAAAVLAENERFPGRGEAVAALVLDGTGWGPDGTAWGCEWLLIQGDLGWNRLARATPVALIGGERAVREPWRVTLAACEELGSTGLLRDHWASMDALPANFEGLRALARGAKWPRASGAGRFFEAAGALFGLGTNNTYEGELAARFEALAYRARGDASPWPEVGLPDGVNELPIAALLHAALQRLHGGEERARCAFELHLSFCELAAALSARVVPAGTTCIALGGGCMANRLLQEHLRIAHEARGFRTLLPRSVPPGDGGLAYGQAVLASVALARGHAQRLAQPTEVWHRSKGESNVSGHPHAAG